MCSTIDRRDGLGAARCSGCYRGDSCFFRITPPLSPSCEEASRPGISLSYIKNEKKNINIINQLKEVVQRGPHRTGGGSAILTWPRRRTVTVMELASLQQQGNGGWGTNPVPSPFLPLKIKSPCTFPSSPSPRTWWAPRTVPPSLGHPTPPRWSPGNRGDR